MGLHHGASGHDRPRVIGIKGHSCAQLFEGQLMLTRLHVHKAKRGAKVRIFRRISERNCILKIIGSMKISSKI